MKVRELIEILEDMNPDAEVLTMSQPNWPFEYAIAGVTTREEMDAGQEDDDERDYPPGISDDDVFIVEGRQLRYGSKSAWETARR